MSDLLSFQKTQLISLRTLSFSEGLPSHFLSANGGHPELRFRRLDTVARGIEVGLRCREGRLLNFSACTRLQVPSNAAKTHFPS